MKRDMDLIRRILIGLEDSPYSPLGVDVCFDDVPRDAVQYHLMLLYEQGLIEARVSKSLSEGTKYIALRLKWDGHDFIEAIRPDTNWNRLKSWVKEAGKSLTLEALRQGAAVLFG